MISYQTDIDEKGNIRGIRVLTDQFEVSITEKGSMLARDNTPVVVWPRFSEIPVLVPVPATNGAVGISTRALIAAEVQAVMSSR